MRTRELQKLWWDWLGTSERLLRSLHEQTAALTLRDAPRVERIQPELDKMVAMMKQIDEAAVACARKLAEELGAEPNLRSLVTVLEKAEAQQLQALANRVTVAARNVQAVIDKNQTLLHNEMSYISGTLSLMARAAGDSQGPFKRGGRAAILIDQAA
jgi:phosphate uptake regulator